MHDPLDASSYPRIGSLFSGYGGLDLAVEHATGGETVVGKQAGLAPGTRSGLWSFMATAIEALQPRYVVIENVRGLLSTRAVRTQMQGATPNERNPDHATEGGATATLRHLESDRWGLGDQPARPLRALGAVLGDLAELGLHARWSGLPASSIGAPHHRFRIFILAWRHSLVSDAAGLGLFPRRGEPGAGDGPAGHDRPIASDHRLRPTRAGWLTDQTGRVGDAVRPDRDHLRRWGRYATAIARWEHITGRPAPAPALIGDRLPRPAPEFVEWFMGLPAGWVTDPAHGLTANQQITALGNGVLPLQAVGAIRALMSGITS